MLNQIYLDETLSGIGIYASGALEAVYVGHNLSMGQIAAMPKASSKPTSPEG